jgi:hypothetical protein
MTTVLDKNVHNLAITGNFDNCQVSGLGLRGGKQMLMKVLRTS